MVCRVLLHLAASSPPVMYPKSKAARLANKARPILVGDVRCAIIGEGFSWKLSGGNQFSSSVTNCSKKDHVLRADLQRNMLWACESLGFFSVSSLLKRQASAGAKNHSINIGAAT